jgi:hypothetical protein
VRTTRAGAFLVLVEQRINSLVVARVLSWEHFLRTPATITLAPLAGSANAA